MGYEFGPRPTVTGDFETINRAHAKAEKWGLGYPDRVPVGAVSLEQAYADVEPELVRRARLEELDLALDGFVQEAPMALKCLTRARNSNGHDGISRCDKAIPPKPEVAHPVRDELDAVRARVGAELREALDYAAWLERRGFNGSEKPGTVQRQWQEYVENSWHTIHSLGDESLRNTRLTVMGEQPWAKHFGARNGLSKEVALRDLKWHSAKIKHGHPKRAPKYAKVA